MHQQWLMQDPSTLKALTRDLIAPATFLQLTTLLHSAPSVPDSSKTDHKYLNSKTCSKHIPSTQKSHSNPSSPPKTTLLLPAWIKNNLKYFCFKYNPNSIFLLYQINFFITAMMDAKHEIHGSKKKWIGNSSLL